MQKNSDSLFLGWGAKWGQSEAQDIYDITKTDIEKLIGENRPEFGEGYIHGVIEKEEPIKFPLLMANGHTLITGATGSGKTRFFDLILTQLVMRGETVLFFDPKGDADIRKLAKKACLAAGSPERYVQWHPAYPEDSIRLNPLKNFQRTSEIAARVVALIPEDGDSFYRDIAYTITQLIVDSLVMLGRSITLKTIRYYFEHFGELIERVILSWCKQNKYNTNQFTAKLEKLATEDDRALFLINFYRKKVESEHPNQTIGSMNNLYVEKRRNLDNSTSNATNALNKVTTGILEEMLSPESDKDKRPSFDLSGIIRGDKVLVVGTDSMADAVTSSALCKMMLADACAVASCKYNYPEDGDDKIINVIVDEASEVLCTPLIQMLNKARGAKFRLWVATQTISDFTAELGSEAKADQIIANTNNFISFRCADTATQERVCAKSPPTKVKYVMRTQGFSSSNSSIDDMGANIGERLMEEEAPLFPPQLMGSLPNLEFVASLAGGALIKGRIPILSPPRKKRSLFSLWGRNG